jgi:hypothetical protein
MWPTWAGRKARILARRVLWRGRVARRCRLHIGNRCVCRPLATLHTHLSDFMNVCIARRAASLFFFFFRRVTRDSVRDTTAKAAVYRCRSRLVIEALLLTISRHISARSMASLVKRPKRNLSLEKFCRSYARRCIYIDILGHPRECFSCNNSSSQSRIWEICVIWRCAGIRVILVLQKRKKLKRTVFLCRLR